MKRFATTLSKALPPSQPGIHCALAGGFTCDLPASHWSSTEKSVKTRVVASKTRSNHACTSSHYQRPYTLSKIELLLKTWTPELCHVAGVPHAPKLSAKRALRGGMQRRSALHKFRARGLNDGRRFVCSWKLWHDERALAQVFAAKIVFKNVLRVWGLAASKGGPESGGSPLATGQGKQVTIKLSVRSKNESCGYPSGF